MQFRLLSIVMVLLMLTFTVRIGDFVMDIARGQPSSLKPASAQAQETPKTPAKDQQAETETPSEGDKDASTQEAKPSAQEETTVQGLEEEDPFAPRFSEEEIKVLESLSQRRDQLDQRERDLEQREKLLQAAEKKVDEKVAELDKLRKEIEALLETQQNLQDTRITQLVKIYESMKPKDAAAIFNEMDFDVLLSLIDKMSERKVAPILAAMDPRRARHLSAQLAQQRALPKPEQGAQ